MITDLVQALRKSNVAEPITVITFGTFDLVHTGHIRILQRAREYGDRLVVGVSTDALTYEKKNRMPVQAETDRLEVISSIRWVDGVFLEGSLELKRQYIEHHSAKVLVMGDDWRGAFDHLDDLCDVVYLPRTPSISTTALVERVVIGRRPDELT